MAQSLFNGPIDNIELLASAARTATITSPTQVNTLYRGLIIYLNITAASGTGGLTPNLMAIDQESGATVAIGAIGSAKTATGLFVYVVYPATGLAVVDGGALVYPLPSNWAVKIAHGDSSSYTYSVSADLIP